MPRQLISAGLLTLGVVCGVVPAENWGLSAAAVAIGHAPTNDVFREDMSERVLLVDYESGISTPAGQGVVAEGPTAKDAFSLSEQQARSGRFCLRTKVARSDGYISYGKHRAETTTMRCQATRYNEGDVFRYRFSFMAQDDWQFDSRDSVDIIWQFKRFDGGPDMFIGAKGKDIVLRCGHGGQWTLVQNFMPGEWMDMCVIARWSVGTAGWVESYCKRASDEQFKKVASFQGPNMRDGRTNSTYLTWGIYKPDIGTSTATNPRVIYHDDILVEKMTGNPSQLQEKPCK